MGPAHLQPFTPSDWFVLGILLSPIVALCVWGALRLRRARAAVREAIRAGGDELVQMKQRWLRQGPFFWTTTRSQVVYRVVVRDSAGRQRTGWARWGRTWFLEPDTRLEFRWDE